MREFNPSQVPPPPDCPTFDWSVCSGKIALEIGCGNGIHPIQFARKNPDFSIIAIEQTKNKFASFQRSLTESESIPNLYPVRADAIWWCAHNLKLPSRLDEIFILYPNPYPKESQSNKRFHNMPFMGFLLKHLKPGGIVHTASNIPNLIAEAKKQFVSTWDLSLQEEVPLPSCHSPRTAFEKKYLERGEPCINLVFKKK